MKIMILAMVAVALAGCVSEQEHRQRWTTACMVKSDFTLRQCDLLYDMKKSQEEDSAWNSLATGIAIGAAAGTAGRR